MPKILTKSQNGKIHTGVFGYIGIDPGKFGGIAYICGDSVEVNPIPPTEGDLWRLIPKCTSCHCTIELIHSSPQMGVVSAFTFGEGYGRLRMGLIAAGVPFDEVRPQVWQQALGIPPRKKGRKVKTTVNGKAKIKKVGGETDNQWKDRLRAKSQQLFPGLDCWDWGLEAQRTISDALLIAEYTRRKHEGRL